MKKRYSLVSLSSQAIYNMYTYVDVLISHAVVGLLEVLEQSTSKTTKSNKNKGFLVEDVNFLRDKEGGQTSTEGDEASLGDKGVARQGVDDARSLLLGFNYY
jgi:hypothetical protein